MTVKQLAEEFAEKQGYLTPDEEKTIAKKLTRALKEGEVDRVYLVGPNGDGWVYIEYSEYQNDYTEVRAGIYAGGDDYYRITYIEEIQAFTSIREAVSGMLRSEIVHLYREHWK